MLKRGLSPPPSPTRPPNGDRVGKQSIIKLFILLFILWLRLRSAKEVH